MGVIGRECKIFRGCMATMRDPLHKTLHEPFAPPMTTKPRTKYQKTLYFNVTSSDTAHTCCSYWPRCGCEQL